MAHAYNFTNLLGLKLGDLIYDSPNPCHLIRMLKHYFLVAGNKTGARFTSINIAHPHMRIVKLELVGQSARILPIHAKEWTNEENQRERQPKVRSGPLPVTLEFGVRFPVSAV